MRNPWKLNSDWHLDNSQFRPFQNNKRQPTISQNASLDGTKVDSSAIKEIKYDKESKVLSILFINGNTYYDFEEVPEEVVKSFLESKSKGSYYNTYIKKYRRKE